MRLGNRRLSPLILAATSMSQGGHVLIRRVKLKRGDQQWRVNVRHQADGTIEHQASCTFAHPEGSNKALCDALERAVEWLAARKGHRR